MGLVFSGGTNQERREVGETAKLFHQRRPCDGGEREDMEGWGEDAR